MPRNRVGQVLLFVLVGLFAFGLTAWADQAVPEARPARQPARAEPLPTPIPMLVMDSRGASEAAGVLEASSEHLPFAVLLPAPTPSGYELAKAQFRVAADGQALLDVLYMNEAGSQLHVFQANFSNDSPALAKVAASDEIRVNGTTWRYLLLSFPQPDGSSLLMHFADRAFDGQTYMSVGLDAEGDVEGDRARLLSLLSALR